MRYLIAALVGVFATASAYAADIGGMKDVDTRGRALVAVDAPSSSWTGLWAAALAGYSMSNTDLSLSIFDNHEQSEAFGDKVDSASLSGLGGEGFDATLQLGGDYQIGRVVLGGWAEYQFGGVESSARVLDFARLDVEQNDSYGVFARAGLTSGDTLFYGAFGWVFTEADATLRLGGSTVRKTFEFDGPAAEGGIEHKFTPTIRGKLSARYTWLDEEKLAAWGEDECLRGELHGEPGVWSVKAGVVISTGSLF